MVEYNREQSPDKKPQLSRRELLKLSVPFTVSLFSLESCSNNPPSGSLTPTSTPLGYDSRYQLTPVVTPTPSVEPSSTTTPKSTINTRKLLPTFRINGIHFPSWKAGEYQQAPTLQSLKNISDLAPNFVGIIATQYQTDINSTTIAANSDTPSDTDLNTIINQSHNLGYSVMLKPQINLSNDPNHWHGEIGLGFTTENQWQSWFSSYTNMITHYADLAEKAGVELFIIGNEYVSSTVDRANDWNNIVAQVRLKYSGPITYAAHMYDFGSINWWSKLDLMGLNPYYGLTQTNNPTFDQLTQAWSSYITSIENVVNKWNKLLVFPEIGYLSADGTNIHPWDTSLIYNPNVKVDLTEQVDCIHALYHSFWSKTWWYGVVWWMWNTDPNIGGVNDKGYTPAGKPAANIIKLYNQTKP